MQAIFREYDIRGVYPKELNEKSVKLIGYLLGKAFLQKDALNVAIGYDAREHSPILRDYLISGLHFAGCKVFDMGLVPTPVNYFANFAPQKTQDGKEVKIDASIMITGSHNPKEYNGFKITLKKEPFFGEQIYAIGKEFEKKQDLTIPTNTQKEEIFTKKDYIAFLINEFKHLKGFEKKIVLDCGNGVGGVVLEDIFQALDIPYKGLYCEIDGTFPNHHPDPSVEANLKDLQDALQKDGELGFAYDGDCDRVAVLTKKHNIKGDELALILAKPMQNPIVIGEVKCSQIMYDELEKMGATPIMYKTGHSNIKTKMKELNAHLACEVSGHIFFNDRYFGYDDAIYTTLRVLELVKDGIDLDKELKALPKLFSTDELKVKTSEEAKFSIIEEIKMMIEQESPFEIEKIITIDGLRVHFKNGWALVRASNTTPILVTRFEAKSKEDLQNYQAFINKLIKKAQAKLA